MVQIVLFYTEISILRIVIIACDIARLNYYWFFYSLLLLITHETFSVYVHVSNHHEVRGNSQSFLLHEPQTRSWKWEKNIFKDTTSRLHFLGGYAKNTTKKMKKKIRTAKILIMSHRLEVTDWKYLRISRWADSTWSSVSRIFASIL